MLPLKLIFASLIILKSAVKRSLFSLTDWELKLKDEEFMLKAIELGERGRLTSAPNPWVGCVIVTEYGDIIGRGFHAKAGKCCGHRRRAKRINVLNFINQITPPQVKATQKQTQSVMRKNREMNIY